MARGQSRRQPWAVSLKPQAAIRNRAHPCSVYSLAMKRATSSRFSVTGAGGQACRKRSP
jgi:hypothetical protein